jgi:hypothetical protein
MIYYIAQTEQTPEMQLRRLALARTLEANGIPCVVWAEDALAFIHCVPTGLFRLQLLVRDEDMERAISVITSGGQYLAVPSDPTDRDIAFDPSKSLNSFPDSVYLELENEDTTLPREALIHPQSFFHFDLHDKTRVLENLPPTVPTLNQKLRFPTLGAFLDSLVEMILDPTTGRRHLLLNKRLSGYVEYLVDYNVRTYDRVDVQGHPIPEAAALIASARPENRPFIEDIIFLRLPRDWGRLVDERRAILGDKVYVLLLVMLIFS